MDEVPYPPMKLHLRLTRTPHGAVRIDHAYSRDLTPDEYRPWCQVPQARTRIRRVWNELRVLVAIWLERDRQDRATPWEGEPRVPTSAPPT